MLVFLLGVGTVVAIGMDGLLDWDRETSEALRLNPICTTVAGSAIKHARRWQTCCYDGNGGLDGRPDSRIDDIVCLVISAGVNTETLSTDK